MFYLITTAASFIGITVATKAMIKKFDEEGYDYHKKSKSKEEEKLDTVKALAILLCPGVNLIFASILVFAYEQVYEGFKKALIKEKLLTKREKPEEQKKQEEINVDLKTNEINRTRQYSDLSPQEKLEFLEAEKRRLLSQKEVTEEAKTTPYNDRGAYDKRK